MTERFTDDLSIAPADASPHHAADLLRMLGGSDSPRQVQIEIVEHWLSSDPPVSRALRLSLAHLGLPTPGAQRAA